MGRDEDANSRIQMCETTKAIPNACSRQNSQSISRKFAVQSGLNPIRRSWFAPFASSSAQETVVLDPEPGTIQVRPERRQTTPNDGGRPSRVSAVGAPAAARAERQPAVEADATGDREG